MGVLPAKNNGRRGRVHSYASTLCFCLVWLCVLVWSRTGAAPIQFGGNLAFIPDQQGQLKTVALGSGTNASTLSTFSNLTGIVGVSLHGQYASVAVSHSGLYTFDISQSPPELIPGGRFISDGTAEDVTVTGTTAFLADGEKGIVVLDLFNPAGPLPLPTLNPPGVVTSVEIVSNRLFAACGSAGVLIANISNVADAYPLAQFNTAAPARRIRVVGNYAYVICDGARLEIVNVQNPTAPTLSSAYVAGGFFADVDVSGNYAVVANTNGFLRVLNLSNPASPVVQGTIPVAGGAFGVRINGANALVRNGAGELVVVPVPVLNATPPQLQEGVASQLVATGQTAVFSVLVSGTMPLTYQWSRNGVPLSEDVRFSGTTNAWLIISNALPSDAGTFSVTISNSLGQLISSNSLVVVNPGAPVWRGAFNPGGYAENLDVDDFKVFVAAGANGLEAYDALNPRFPQRYSGNVVEGYATGIRVNEGHAYVAAATNGLQIFSTTGINVADLIAATNSPGNSRGVHLAGGLIYVAAGERGLAIYRLNNQTNFPTYVGGYSTPGFARNVFVANGIAYVAAGTNGLQLLSVTNPAAIVKLGEYDTPGEAFNVRVVGDKAYVADGANGMLILNVAEPSAPTLIGSYPNGAPALDLDLAVNIVALARGSNGVETLDVSNPASIVALGTNYLPMAKSLRIEGNNLYVAAGPDGVQIFELVGLDVSYPDLTVTPTEIIALPGETVAYHANATGAAPLTYQWYRGTTPLFDDANTFGSDRATLVRSNLNLSDSDEYFVAVRNGWNLLSFAAVNLTVVPVGTPVLRSGYFNDGDALNLHLVGQTAFVASRLNGLQAIDCRDPLNPVLIGQQSTLGLAQDVCVRGHYAYVAAWDAGLEIFDISDPTNLVRVGVCATPGFAHAVRVVGNYAHVANRTGGYAIIDVRKPAQPAVVGRVATGGMAEGLAVEGAKAYIAGSAAGLKIFDVSNPLAPAALGQFDTPGNAESVAVSGSRAYVSDYNHGVCIVSVTNPTAPVLLGQLQTQGDAFQVQVRGDRAYVAEGIGKVEMADISNPAQPKTLSTSLAGSSVRSLQIVGKHAFLADRTEGFIVSELLGLGAIPPAITDISASTTNLPGSDLVLSVAVEGTPPLGYLWYRNGMPLTNSASINGVSSPSLHCPNLSETNAGNYTVVITNALGSATSGVVAVTIQSYGQPVSRGSLDTPGISTATAVAGNVAYLADGAGGLRLVDLSNPDTLVSLGAYAPTGNVLGLCLQTNLLYLALGTNGIAILDVSKPAQPAWLGAFDTPGTAFTLDVTNGRAFVADGEGGLRILSVTNPASPVALGFLATGGSTRDVRVQDNIAFVADGLGGLRIVMTTNPALPTVIGSYVNSNPVNAVRLAGNRAYLANGGDGLQILDVQNPALPVLLGGYPATNAIALDVSSNLVVLSDAGNRDLILDVSNPANVLLIASTSSEPAASGVSLSGNLVFMASGANGLRRLDLFGVAPRPTAFLTQPVSVSTLFGGVAQFQATPTGTAPLVYRWYHNDFPVYDDAHIAGAATPQLIVSNVAFADAGDYQLRVLGAAGVANSASAKLTFIGPLQAQLNAATNGAIIQLQAGMITENLTFNRDVTLVGSWWNQPVVSGGLAGPALQVQPGATVSLQGIALRNGFSLSLGGGVINQGNLTLDHCLVADSVAESGGGIANLGKLTLVRTVISNNFATVSGGGLYNGPLAVAMVTNSVFTANTAEEGGGVINLGTNAFSGVLLAGNAAQGNLGLGGGYRQSSGFGQFLNSTLSGNVAVSSSSQAGTALGGGARIDGGRVEFQFCTVANNLAAFRAGGISAVGASEVHTRNSVFAGNTAPGTPDFGGTMYSDGFNLVQQTSAALTVAGDVTGNLLNVEAKLGPLQDNGGPTLTHVPVADSPVIDAGAPPGPPTDARGIPRPFDVPWLSNFNGGWDIGASEFVDTSLYLVMSNRNSSGFTLAWATNAVLQASPSPDAGWLDQTNLSPLFVATTNPQKFFRLHAPFVPVFLKTNNETTNGFDLSWVDYGILERAPTTAGPWDVLTARSPFHVTTIPGQNEFFRLRVIQH